MTAFDYLALDGKGRRQKGVVSADSSTEAARTLKAKNLHPLRIHASKTRLNKSAKPKAAKLKAAELVLFTRQMATLIGASAPVEEALHTLALQSENDRLRRIILDVRAQVIGGQKFSSALAEQGRSFPKLYQAIVAAGETSGDLAPVLDRLARYLERSEQLRSKTISTLIYPCVLSVVATVVVIALMTFVVPRVVEQFDSFGGTLPFLTRFMIGLSDVLTAYGWLMVLALVGGGVAFAQAMRQQKFRARFDAMILRLPLLGGLIRDVSAARLARTLATLISSGTPVLQALIASKDVLTNQVLVAAQAKAVQRVGEGEALSKALRMTSVFPPIIIYMAAVGERSGTLPAMLDKAADHLEDHFERFTTRALNLAEPGIIVLMGGIVALIVLSILLPILQLNSLALG